MTPEQKSNILEILDGAADLTVATVRADGYPQATTVSFVHDGLAIYFGCGPESQRARNIAQSEKVSLTVNLPYAGWGEIRGLSLGGRARIVTHPAELGRVLETMLAKFPQIHDFAGEDERAMAIVMRVEPEIISLLDYRKGFGHTEEIRL